MPYRISNAVTEFVSVARKNELHVVISLGLYLGQLDIRDKRIRDEDTHIFFSASASSSPTIVVSIIAAPGSGTASGRSIFVAHFRRSWKMIRIGRKIQIDVLIQIGRETSAKVQFTPAPKTNEIEMKYKFCTAQHKPIQKPTT